VQLGRDYLPVFDSPSADLQGQVVFVGYGIVDPAQGIDDYAGVDVKNCIVLFLRGNRITTKAPSATPTRSASHEIEEP